MFFLAPRFAVRAHEGGLGVLDLRSRTEIDVSGSLAADILERRTSAVERLTALATLEPDLAPLARALETGRLRPWSRAALLEGSGYDRLFVELTAKCNERCVHCYAESSPDRTESLSLQAVLDVLDAGRRLGFASVQLTGGDPLIAETCLPAARRAVELAFPQVEVYTNGLGLKGEVFSSLRDLGVAFAFSFYSHREETHDAVTRVPGSQRRTLAAIERCVQAGLRTRVSIILQSENRSDHEATVALLERAGVAGDDIATDGVRAVGRGNYADEPLPLSANRHDGTRGPDGPSFGGTLAVLSDGSVVPCIFQRHTVLGSVHTADLEAIARAEVPLSPLALPSPEQDALAQSRLGCVECRLRHHLLTPPLVTLGRKAMS